MSNSSYNLDGRLKVQICLLFTFFLLSIFKLFQMPQKNVFKKKKLKKSRFKDDDIERNDLSARKN